MKKILLLFVVLIASIAADAQWVKQNVDTTASLRGLSVVNEKVVWASGTGGTVIRTIDGGKTWKVMTVPGAEKLDFRDIEAFDAKTAYILSIGNGESSRIYKTADGGATWKEQFRNKDEKAFFDALSCRGIDDCLALSDPVDDKFVLIGPTRPTLIKGERGRPFANFEDYDGPSAARDEAAFAASGTCLITQGSYKTFIVSGGKRARVFYRVADGAWNIVDPGFIKGTSGSGIFSIAMFDLKIGVIVGGNYEKPEEAKDNLALTTDGGETWKLGTGP